MESQVVIRTGVQTRAPSNTQISPSLPALGHPAPSAGEKNVPELHRIGGRFLSLIHFAPALAADDALPLDAGQN